MGNSNEIYNVMSNLDELRNSEGSLRQEVMMSRSRKFYSELQVFYPENTWQRQAVSMIINLTDGTPRKINYAGEQLRLLLGQILPDNNRIIQDQIEVGQGEALGYGWDGSDWPAVDSSELATAGKQPKDFGQTQRKSYLTNLLGLTYGVFSKEGRIDIMKSMDNAKALIDLLLKYENGEEDLSDQIRKIVRKFSDNTNNMIDVKDGSELAKWVQTGDANFVNY